MSGGPFGGDSWQPLFQAMKELRASWPARGWSWDARLPCVTSSFSVEFEEKARSAVAIVLASLWTSTTLQQAPAPVRDLAQQTGGLRAGQLIFASAGVAAGFAYGLWWPWGDGMTTSMRIGLGGSRVSSDTLQRLRDVFGVEL
jgi:hypothetical protein